MTSAQVVQTASITAVGARDRSIDLVRAVCIIGVVLLHSMMVGVTVDAAGPAFINASDGTWWIVPLSWVLQVMPLFFVIGGFAGATALRRARARGGDGVGFVSARVHRLLLPAAVTVGVAGSLLALLTLAGVPADLVALAGFRFGQPLWFLGVFLVCQALLPALLRLHEAAPWRTIAALAGGAATVDLVRLATGIDAIGFLNLAFVWLTLQQVGFLLADGWVDRLGRRTRWIAVVVAVAGLVLSFANGVHSPDLVANINPPTTALLLVGVAHTALFSLFREPLARFAARRVPAAITGFTTPRAMTVYLWHMPVLLGLAGMLAAGAMLTGMPLPAVDGPWWWLTRPVWLAVALAATAAVAVPLSRIETLPAPPASRSVWRIGTAVVAATSAIAMLLVAGASVATACLALGVFALALRLASRVEREQRIAESFVDSVQVSAHAGP